MKPVAKEKTTVSLSFFLINKHGMAIKKKEEEKKSWITFPQLNRSTWHSVYGHVSGILPLELRQKPSPDGLTVTWTRRKEIKKASGTGYCLGYQFGQ